MAVVNLNCLDISLLTTHIHDRCTALYVIITSPICRLVSRETVVNVHYIRKRCYPLNMYKRKKGKKEEKKESEGKGESKFHQGPVTGVISKG